MDTTVFFQDYLSSTKEKMRVLPSALPSFLPRFNSVLWSLQFHPVHSFKSEIRFMLCRKYHIIPSHLQKNFTRYLVTFFCIDSINSSLLTLISLFSWFRQKVYFIYFLTHLSSTYSDFRWNNYHCNHSWKNDAWEC